MGSGVDISWVRGRHRMGSGVDIPWLGGQYTMGRGSIYHGQRGSICHV